MDNGGSFWLELKWSDWLENVCKVMGRGWVVYRMLRVKQWQNW